MKLEPLKLGGVVYWPIEEGDDDVDFFEVMFVISCDHGDEGAILENSFQVSVPVVLSGRDQPYGKVEELGAQALPAFFRTLADAVEADNLRALKKRLEREAAPQTSPE